MIKVNTINTNNYISLSKLPDTNYVINPYVGCPHKCIYCYAEFMKRFTGHNEEWGNFIDIKMCEKPININKIKDSVVLIGSVTDAYNPFEHKYKITQSVLKQLLNSSANIEVLTKSSLVTRDIELFKEIPNIRIGISINTLDDTFRKQTEPFASSIEERIEALRLLHEAGISTYLFMSPIFPGITNFAPIIEKSKNYVDTFYFENLNLRAGYFKRVFTYINDFYPDLKSLYNEIYINKNMEYWEELKALINNFCTNNNIPYKLYFYHDKIKKK